MERLTNIGSNGEIWITDNDETRRFGRKESAYKKLAEYEDLEEQGLLLRLKCNTGDTVYYRTNNNDIYPIKINEISISNSDVIYNGYFMKCTYEFDNSDFGKTVFLTQAEAEQKLKEMESK